MKKVVIVGGGFAGVSALTTLAGSRLELTLIDKKETSDFLPCLPDIISKKIDPEFLAINLADLTKQFSCKFLNQKVTSVDLAKKAVNLTSPGRRLTAPRFAMNSA